VSAATAAWLAAALELCALSEDDRDYVMGRGATAEVIDQWGLKTFEPPPEPCPDQSLHHHYGPNFDRFEGKIIYPLFSPRGRLLGFDSRTRYRKDDDRYLLMEARWNPVWIGMPGAMQAIWAGRDIIVVEGRFDVWAMLHATTRGQAVLGSGPAHLSYKQAQFLRRWARGDVYMAYDNDDAGKRGTADAIKNLSFGRVSCIELRYGRSGDDPGELWDRGGTVGVREAFPHL
jgi:DNA primase